VDTFLEPLPVGRLPGVGKVTGEKLGELGIKTVGDLRGLDLPTLEGQFGRYRLRLFELARGIDNSEVVPDRPVKSMSAEDTFEHDVPLAETEPMVRQLAEKVWSASRKESRIARTVVLKLKTSEFNILTRSHTPDSPPCSCEELTSIALSLREYDAIIHFQTKNVTSLAITPDDRQVISASNDSSLKLWDLTTGELLNTLEGHSHECLAVAITPDGDKALSASPDNTLKVWDLKMSEPHNCVERHEQLVSAVAVTADRIRAVSTSLDNTVKVWELKTGKLLHTMEGHSDSVHALAITADGKKAITASSDATLKVWEVETGKLLHTLKGHDDAVNALAIEPRDLIAASVSVDQKVNLWNIETGRLVATFTADVGLRCCAIDSHGTAVLAGDELGRVHFLRIEDP